MAEKEKNVIAQTVKRAQEILFFNEKTIQKTAKDIHAGKTATGIVLSIIILTQLIVYIPTSTTSIASVGMGALYAMLVFIALTSATHFCAKYLLKGKGTSIEVYRAAGHSYLVNIFLVVPMIGGVIAYIWYMLSLIKNISVIHHLSKTKAFFAVMIPVVIFVTAILLFIIAVLKTVAPTTATISIP